MEEKSTAAKITLGQKVSYSAYRTCEALMRLLPIELVSVIGGVFGVIGMALLPGRCKTVKRNLRIALADNTGSANLNKLTLQTFWNSGANFFAAIRANTLTGDELAKHMDFVGLENIRTAQAKGKGIILLLAHMGNWESLTRMNLMVDGLDPFGGLYRPLKNPLLDRLVKRRRQDTGTKLFSRTDGFFTPIAHLKEGGCLGVFADQHASKRGVAVPLFGKMTSLTSLPALMHRRTGAPIIPVSMCTVAPGSWKVVVHPAIEANITDRNSAVKTTCLCAKAFEQMMSTSPTDVLWMHGYWKVGNKLPLKIDGSLKAEELVDNSPSKPFKVVIYHGQASATSDPIDTAIRSLADYRDDIEIITVGTGETHPSTSHHIHTTPDKPPQIIANEIIRYDREQTTPVDCLIDLTADSSGEQIFNSTGIQPRFALTGKYQSVVLKRRYSNPDSHGIPELLECLGINGIPEPIKK